MKERARTHREREREKASTKWMLLDKIQIDNNMQNGQNLVWIHLLVYINGPGESLRSSQPRAEVVLVDQSIRRLWSVKTKYSSLEWVRMPFEMEWGSEPLTVRRRSRQSPTQRERQHRRLLQEAKRGRIQIMFHHHKSRPQKIHIQPFN